MTLFQLCILFLLFFKTNAFLVYYSDDNNVINDVNYNRLFLALDNLITIRSNFTKQEFDYLSTVIDIKGFILPGGKSNFSDINSNYWKFLRLAFNTDKPIIGICLGFEHILKYLSHNKVFFNKCDMRKIVYDNKIHNHKWCLESSHASFLLNSFQITYFTYKNKVYVEKIKNNRILAFSYHPEKAIISQNINIFNSAMNDIKEIKKILKIY